MIAALTRLSTFSAFRHRNYRLFWTGMLGSQVGTWMQSTAQSYLVWELTRSALATSLVTLFFSLPSTVLSLVGGVVADRMDRRRLILVTQTVFLLQAVVLTVLTFAGRIRIWEIYALALMNGTVMAFDSPGRQSMLPSLVPREDLSNAVALNSTVFNASRVVGPPLAGLVYAAVGPGWCFALNAVSFLAILYPLWIMRLTRAPTGIVRTHLWGDLREGLSYVRRHQVVRTLLILVAVAGCVMAVLATCNATIQGYVTDSLRGRIMSIYTLALIGSGPLNAAIAGTLGSWLGADRAIGISGLVMGFSVGIVAWRNRAVVAIDMVRATRAEQVSDYNAGGRAAAEGTED